MVVINLADICISSLTNSDLTIVLGSFSSKGLKLAQYLEVKKTISFWFCIKW